MSDHYVLLCTCPDDKTAREIAGQLVAEKLAACVNILPGLTSVYEWQGQVESDPEVLLIIKTAGDRRQAVIERVPALHPYEVPEVIALPIEAGLPAYLDWIIDETRPR
ncbi:periplasmic divalent cation tolerance protein [Natronospira proteinivora]|uniref:Periplasmic divalent cation tolerance protein n=1 Tax=Natronospira proteinivora TaxID=1807133 RepID=A0ABT1GBE3_9GAMM|nr:divalent-cation tolerance protein CutA [Natronospira proteinivora]MCP1728612.1 periplasmic divalent cation tolerance protein [Natronospira proteinivora]